ncbi:MAG TPA: hypothetical protein VIA63_08940 [Candidatus Limnocylindria bacterium]|jgi:hypothetical protein
MENRDFASLAQGGGSALMIADPPASNVITPPIEERGEPALDTLRHAILTREWALVDTPLITAAAIEIRADIAKEISEIDVDAILAQAREVAASLFGILGSVAHVPRPSFHLPQPRARVRTRERQAVAAPVQVKKIRIGKTVEPKKQRREGPSFARRVIGRVRFGRVVTRGLLPGVLAAVVIAAPADLVSAVASELGSAVVALQEKLRASFQPPLARAPFDVPPLEAYGATFELEAAYPTAMPGATVEWVVALRNTGSAGWYRGIDGAQASLIFADGSTAGVQTTDYVGPGQVGWFVVQFRAPEEVGASRIPLYPRIDGRGALADLGLYVDLTVAQP